MRSRKRQTAAYPYRRTTQQPGIWEQVSGISPDYEVEFQDQLQLTGNMTTWVENSDPTTQIEIPTELGGGPNTIALFDFAAMPDGIYVLIPNSQLKTISGGETVCLIDHTAP